MQYHDLARLVVRNILNHIKRRWKCNVNLILHTIPFTEALPVSREIFVCAIISNLLLRRYFKIPTISAGRKAINIYNQCLYVTEYQEAAIFVFYFKLLRFLIRHTINSVQAPIKKKLKLRFFYLASNFTC